MCNIADVFQVNGNFFHFIKCQLNLYSARAPKILHVDRFHFLLLPEDLNNGVEGAGGEKALFSISGNSPVGFNRAFVRLKMIVPRF